MEKALIILKEAISHDILEAVKKRDLSSVRR
jgi:hypothetical protein